MKKKLRIILPLVLIAVCIAVIVTLYAINHSKKDSCTLQIGKTSVSKFVGEKFNLFDECDIVFNANNSQRPYFISEKPSSVKVSSITGDIECVEVDNVKILVNLKETDTKTITKEILILVKASKNYPTSASLSESVVILSPNNLQGENILTVDGDLEVSVEYEKGIVSYDYNTGKILSNGTIGEDTVYVLVRKSNSEYFELSFKVKIVASNEFSVVKQVEVGKNVKITYQEMLIQSDDFLELNNFSVGSPDVANIVYEASYYGFIIVEAKKVGECCISFNDGFNSIEIKIVVV